METKNEVLVEIERYSPVDLTSIIKEAMKFNDILSETGDIRFSNDYGKVWKNLMFARISFANAKNLLRSLLKPEENEFIKEAEKSHHWLVDDLGRVDNKLEEAQELDKNEIRIKSKSGHSRVASYYNYLLESYEGLVFNTLKNAFEKYLRTKDAIKLGEKDKSKDLNEKKQALFIYYLFLEMYHASLSIGVITRTQQNIKGGKIMENFSYPSAYPMGMIDEDKIRGGEIDSYQNFYTNPFEEEDVMAN